MRARLPILILAGALSSSSAGSDTSNSNSAREWAVDAQALFAPAPAMQAAELKVRRPVRGSYAPDTRIEAMVDRIARETGIPVSVMRFHVARESGFRPDARNPRSTATGLLQVIHGTHEAIVGRRMPRAEHYRLMQQPEYALRVGSAHIRECLRVMPGASAQKLWRECHVPGLARHGGSFQMAARHYRPDSGGWLARGSVAMPWAISGDRSAS